MDDIRSINKTRGLAVAVRPQHFPSTLPSALCPRCEPPEREKGEKKSDDRDGPSNSSAKKSRKGQNKKRPRDSKLPSDPISSLCMSMVRTGTCPYTDCRFSHDVASALKCRPVDLGDTCVIYEEFGRCPFGLKCRWGGSHIDKGTGANLSDPEKERTHERQSETVLNATETKTMQLLRRNKYPFSTARNCTTFTPTPELWGGVTPPKMPSLPEFRPNKRDPDDVVEAMRLRHEEEAAEIRRRHKEEVEEFERGRAEAGEIPRAFWPEKNTQ